MKMKGYTNILFGPKLKFITKDDKKTFSKIIPLVDNNKIQNEIIKIIKFYKRNNVKFLILDHYKINLKIQNLLKINKIKWLQFDLFADKKLIADIVLNYSPASVSLKYDKVLDKKKSRLCLGPKYAILRREFSEIKKSKIRKEVKDIFICFGGGNDRGAILKVLKSFKNYEYQKYKITIVSGSQNPNKKQILNWIQKNKDFNVSIFFDRKNLTSLFFKADIAIISGGTISYECATTNTPMMILSIAKNQINTSKFWNKNEAGIYLGKLKDCNSQKIIINFNSLLYNLDLRNKISKNALRLCDGSGVKRISHKINNFINSD